MQKTLTQSEKKGLAKKLAMRSRLNYVHAKKLKDGKKNNTLTEDEIYELEDEIEKLKE